MLGRRMSRDGENFITESASKSSNPCRDEGLAEALANGLLRPHGVVATNFLPHVDLVLSSSHQNKTETFHNRSLEYAEAAPLAAYGNALASKPGISFSIQVWGTQRSCVTFFVVVSLYKINEHCWWSCVKSKSCCRSLGLL